MNDDRNFQKNKKVVKALLKLKCPLLIIGNYLGINSVTAYNHFANLQQEGWNEEAIVPSKSYAAMLALYAKLNQPKIEIDNCLTTTVLREVLKDFLEVNKITEILTYACRHLKPFEEIAFSDDVPTAYKLFIKNIFGYSVNPEDNGRYYWVQYLRRINAVEISPAEKMSDAIDQILQDYSQEVRKNIAPVFTEEICQMVDEKLLPLLDGDVLKVVRMYYGFDQAPMTTKGISEELGLSRTRINQHQQYIKHFLFRHRALIYSENLSWKNLVNQIETAVKTESSKWETELNECYELIERFGKGSSLNKNKHAVAPYDISVRLKHILVKMDIVFFEDVSKYYEADFLKQRDCGVNTLNELKTIVQNFDIEFKKKIRF